MESRPALSEKELDALAVIIARRLSELQGECRLTASEQEAVKDLIRTKNNAVKAFLWICGALVLWIIKDAYVYIANHLTFR